MPSRTPIAVFGFARPQHLDSALRSLARCNRFSECTLYIFCDGPRSDTDKDAVTATRKVARTWADRLGGEVFERPENVGLARSISEHVTSLCEQYGRVIVVEDDLYLSPDFLDFMLQGLATYRDNETVYHIAGFVYPIPNLSQGAAFFLPLASVWGWATWQRAWQHYDFAMNGWQKLLSDPMVRKNFDLGGAYPFSRTLVRQSGGLDSTWDIQWYYALFSANGLGLYPSRSLVRNGGIFGQATHRGVVDHSPEPPEAFDLPRLGERFELPKSAVTDSAALDQIRKYLRMVRHLEGQTWSDRLLYAPNRLTHRLARRRMLNLS